GNMELIMSLGIMQLRMLPNEVLNAVTINGAYAMGLEDTHGTITPGKVANLIVTRPMPSFGFMPYAYGASQISKVILNGKIQNIE
ncbi:MAG: amidohydrolase family protein, partial [Bacteroidales bacterium]|nr:amidohydrolase family protein [Bacteroidales bacterium]